MNSPVLLLAFNRPDLTRQVLDCLQRHGPAELYVAVDGPREGVEADAIGCASVRSEVLSRDWDCPVHTLFRDTNLGCRKAVSQAISWFFDNVEEGIILEDDCVPDDSFFEYCDQMLERYRNDQQVMCVTGDNFQRDMGSYQYSYYFSIYPHCWGWATWRRAWARYDQDMHSYDAQRARARLEQLSSVPGFADYWLRIFDSVSEGRTDSWAYVWTWSCWLHDGLTCTPDTNLVANVGFGPDATHTVSSTGSEPFRPSQALGFPLRHPPDIQANTRFDDFAGVSHFSIRPRSTLGRLKRRLVGLVLRLWPGRADR